MASSPFSRICLSLSGGGFRSAAFSLGNLSYLHQLQYRGDALLQQVVTITTASGGTFPGLRYALDQYEDKPFEETFRTTLAWLKNTNVFDVALSHVRTPAFWDQNPGKRRSLINAAAILYQETLFDNRRLSVFYDKSAQDLPPLKTFIGTSTEFKEGLNFRLAWTRVAGQSLTFGNRRWDLNYPETPYSDAKGISIDALREIRLGDVAAASSAFPGAFEPISFPDDFCPEDSKCLAPLIDEERRNKIEELQRKRSELRAAEKADERDIRDINNQINDLRDICNPATALMDGGILDNQGLGAAFHAEKFLGDGEPFHSLFFVADNASYFVDDFEFETLRKEFGLGARGLLRLLQTIGISVLTLGVVLMALSYVYLGLVTLVIGGLTGGGIYWLNRRITRLSRSALSSQNMRRYWNHLVRLPLPLLVRFLKERGRSFYLMVEQVFLKQIRGFYQERLFNDERFRHRRFISHLYLFLRPKEDDINRSEYRRILKNAKTHRELEAGLPLDKVYDTVTEAYTMPLTLWFTQEEQNRQLPEKLIATGQLTACAMLLNHLIILGLDPEGEEDHRPFATYEEEEKQALRNTFAQLRGDWAKFKENPMWLVNNLS
ncbi:MAG TPA: hypothetical protein DCE41_04780 [Cytophagales bacterium]|nr:hypothetical protein [Cytophagales bacterium]HAA18775.1 hypothetical protein [Cytophagales bacterium]HAP64254.1 hypothetical protein [Cytophagales bacterium]